VFFSCNGSLLTVTSVTNRDGGLTLARLHETQLKQLRSKTRIVPTNKGHE